MIAALALHAPSATAGSGSGSLSREEVSASGSRFKLGPPPRHGAAPGR